MGMPLRSTWLAAAICAPRNGRTGFISRSVKKITQCELCADWYVSQRCSYWRDTIEFRSDVQSCLRKESGNGMAAIANTQAENFLLTKGISTTSSRDRAAVRLRGKTASWPTNESIA